MAEKEYIEKNHLIKTLINSNALYNATVFDLIKSEPTADVQEVVRCGLCKHYKLRGDSKWCVLHMARMHSDDYCSYGAKMDKE